MNYDAVGAGANATAASAVSSSAGRGAPKNRSQTSDPNPMIQERFSVVSRNPIARNSAARSPHSDRTAATLSSPGLIVTTRKIAARLRGAATGCGIALELPAAPDVIIGYSDRRCAPG